MQVLDWLKATIATRQGARYILEAWDEGTESGMLHEQMAYAAHVHGADRSRRLVRRGAVVKLVNGLVPRMQKGEFTLHRTRQ